MNGKMSRTQHRCSLIMILAPAFILVPVFSFLSNDGFPSDHTHVISENSQWNHGIAKRSVQYCGFRLVSVMRAICGGNYAGVSRRSDPEFTDKKDEGSNFRGTNSLDQVSAPAQDKYLAQYGSKLSNDLDQVQPYYNPNSNKQFQKASKERKNSRPRFRRSIIDECCRKSCAISEMRKYCGRQ